MLKRLLTGGLAGGGAIVLVFALTGMVAAATVVTAMTTPDAVPVVVDTTATFEDVDGNGTDDDCQEGLVEANAEAEASAAAAVDANADGTVSVPEAAHSGRTGGTNCNHGGYVSSVATSDDPAGETENAKDAVEETPTECAATDAVVDTATDSTTDTEVTADEAVVADEPAAIAHGAAVSEVAKSDGVGGKNCNHGGAVSEAAHDKAAQDAAKAAQAEARAEAKAARDTARAEAKAARDAARAERKANHVKAHKG